MQEESQNKRSSFEPYPIGRSIESFHVSIERPS